MARLLGGVCAAALTLGIATAPASALRVAGRTTLASATPAGPADAPSADAVISGNGGVIAFDSAAANLVTPRSGVAEVFTVDRRANAIARVAVGIGGASPNGPSSAPAVSNTGRAVAFVSSASNLVAGDDNGVADVFVRTAAGVTDLVSVGVNGQPANGPSSQPSISGDGRYVAFASRATNLVAGDHGPSPQVYVRDTIRGVTAAVSVNTMNTMSNGASDSPAISEDGRAVSFDSTGTNLDPAAHGGPDVYVRLLSSTRLSAGATQLVSRSTRGAVQNRGVPAPFEQVSSVSDQGRYVAFDSNATNLVPNVNGGRTEVFLRDRATSQTTLISENDDGVVADNDSFAPSITAGGHFVVFESLAGNLASGGGPRENVFVRDLHSFTTSVIDVGAGGSRPGAEVGPELLQRPAISDDAHFAVFSSTAAHLTSVATHGVENVFLRDLTPPRTVQARVSVAKGRRAIATLGADDPAATGFLCRIDGGLYLSCPTGRWTLPRLRPGRHVLSVRAGGPGMLYERSAKRLPFTVTG